MYNKLFLFIIIAFINLNFVLVVSAQQNKVLMKMKAGELKDTNVIPLDTSKVVLVVKSIINNLGFKTNHGQITIIIREEGEWRLMLEPDPQIITVKKDGFQSLSVPINIPKEDKSKQIEIIPVDDEPPIIDHIPIKHAIVGDTLNFSARVIDNFQVEKVILHYRFKSDSLYQDEQMYSSDTSKISNIYLAKIHAKKKDIEYYLKAYDVMRNFSFWKDKLNPQTIKIEKGGIPRLWKIIGVASVATVSVALYFLLKKPEESDFPAPPGRPN